MKKLINIIFGGCSIIAYILSLWLLFNSMLFSQYDRAIFWLLVLWFMLWSHRTNGDKIDRTKKEKK